VPAVQARVGEETGEVVVDVDVAVLEVEVGGVEIGWVEEVLLLVDCVALEDDVLLVESVDVGGDEPAVALKEPT